MVNSLQSSTSRSLGVRHQVGLKAVRVSHRHTASVNIHDPVAGKYHRLREDEYFLLCRLDGQCSLNELRDEYQARYPNRRVTPAQINALLFRFHESGLTISHAAGQGQSLLLRHDQERRGRWIAAVSQWLFIRLPGVDPAPVMRWLVPLSRPLLSRVGMLLLSLLVALSVLAMLVHREQYVAELPSVGAWLTMENALILAAVIAVTKIAHELGHAAVSERFGARCRSIGPMLLVFTPALYCDTSQSWMLASRWQRAAVGLAGIATEIVIASVSVWVWMVTPPGLAHTVASHVIVVCGISTVLFNANPLLRYDGYYVLSDLSDVPNLGSRANRRLTGVLRRACLGIADEQPAVERVDESRWLLLYAIAAVTYRWLLMFTIVTFIWMALRPHGLEILGQIAAVFAVTSMLVAAVVPLRKFLKNPANRRKIRMSRLLLTAIVVAGLIAAGFMEYPRHVLATARMVPRSEARVYVSSAGTLVELFVQPGEVVKQGDLIARLENPSFAMQLLDANGRLDQQQLRIESLRQSQTLVPEASEHLAAAEETLQQLRDEVQAIERKQEALSITAPRSGMVIAAAGNRESSAAGALDLDDDALEVDADSMPGNARTGVRLASWSGRPTDAENLSCFFGAGTELLSIADTQHWVAEIAVESAEAERLAVGLPAEVIWDAAPRQRLIGAVQSIAAETFEPTVDSVRRDHPEAARNRWTPQTRYLVSVSMESPAMASRSDDRRAVTWLVGGSGRVKIQTPRQSVWSRVAESFAGVFRFR